MEIYSEGFSEAFSMIWVKWGWGYEDIDSLAPGRYGNDHISMIYKLIIIRNRSRVTALWRMLQNQWELYTGSGNGMVPSGNSSLPAPMLSQIYIAIYRY